jgi:TPR repeat protein
MKKIITILLFAINLIAADVDNLNLDSISQSKLIELEALNKPISNLILAQAYEIGFPDKGIKQDIKKAIELYEKVYNVNKDPIAANKLGMYYFTKENQENKDYKSENYFLNGISEKDFEMNEFNTVMAGVVFYKKKDFKKAISQLEKYADNQEKVGNPTAEIYLAFIYNEMRNNNLATQYLTRACSNPKSTADILNYCEHNVDKEDLNKIVEELENLK